MRPRHLVGLILLLTALRGAEGSVLPAGEYQIDGRYGIVLSQDRSGIWTEVSRADHKPNGRIGTGGFLPGALLAPQLRTPLTTALPTASLATFRTPWTMRPPAAHCVALHAATSYAAPEPSSPLAI